MSHLAGDELMRTRVRRNHDSLAGLARILTATMSLGSTAACTVDVEGGLGWDSNGGANGSDDPNDENPDGDGYEEASPGERAELRRLTRHQLANTLEAVLGSEVLLSAPLEPDVFMEFFSSVGASHVQTSALGAEQYVTAIAGVVSEFMANPDLRHGLVSCDPETSECRQDVLSGLARRAWRRPVEAHEIEPFTRLADENATRFADPWRGLELAIQAVLASPQTLYLVEIGEPDPVHEGQLRYTSVEMASRLSYFLWNGPPDEELLAAGESGALVDPQEIASHARRMAEDPRIRRGVTRFFEEYLALDGISGLTKDPDVFPNASPELFESMRGELAAAIDQIVFDEGGTWADVLDTERAWVDPTLAAFYGVAYPDGATGHIAVPQQDARRGLLGMAGFLASQSHRTRTSPTARGLWVQERLRCVTLPPLPEDVDASFPEPMSDQPQTMRERLEQHRTDPVCATCHVVVDPVGLALEHFDAIGAYRATDAGLAIDVSGELDGTAFDGLPGLASVLHNDPIVADCFARQLYRYASAHLESPTEEPYIASLAANLATSEGLLDVLPELVSSPGFRRMVAK